VVFKFFEHGVQNTDIDTVICCFLVFKCDNSGQPTAESVIMVWKKYDGPVFHTGQALSKIDAAQ
jgi:hypothetical protein